MITHLVVSKMLLNIFIFSKALFPPTSKSFIKCFSQFITLFIGIYMMCLFKVDSSLFECSFLCLCVTASGCVCAWLAWYLMPKARSAKGDKNCNLLTLCQLCRKILLQITSVKVVFSLSPP